MNWKLYSQLSLMMFLEFAIWGAWAPVLAAHLLGKLKFSGKRTGWVYATLWLGCIIAPFAGGQIADRWVATEHFLAVAHLVGGVLLLVAAWRKSFASLFILMFVYSLLYAPTLALVNSLMLQHLTNAEAQAGGIRVWGTIGWIVAGLVLSLWRVLRKSKANYSDCLLLAGVASLLMGVYSFLLPHTPPAKSGAEPWAFVKAFEMLKDPNFLVFIVISFLVTTELQFYYVPTAQFLEDIGVGNRVVPAVMTIAQVAEIIGMAVLLGLLLPRIGYRWALVIGVIAWPLRYIAFSLMKPLWLVISSLPLHGLGYTFFFFVGQLYVGKVAPPDIQASAQALIAVVTLGLGNFLGTQFTGIIMDVFRDKEGRFRWRPIFLVPCLLTVACAIGFLALFRG